MGKVTIIKFLEGLTLSMVLMSSAGSVFSATINMSYASEVGNSAPLWVTQEIGLFEKYGHEVRLILIQGATASIAALLNDDVRAAKVNPMLVITTSLKGMDLVSTLRFNTYVENSIYGKKGIAHISQVKSVAVGAFGSSADFMSRLLVQKAGLKPDVDVAFRQFGSQTNRILAIETGQADAAVVTPPVTLLARKRGFPLLIDASKIKIPYIGSTLAMRRSFINKNRETALNLTKAIIEGICYYKTHKEESIRVLSKYMRINDREVLEENFRAYDFSVRPYVTDEGLELPIQEVAKKEPEVLKADRSRFVDNSIIKELEATGFLDRLSAQYGVK